MNFFDEKIGRLGFGLMRPPMLGDDVDIEQLKTMVDMFMDAGFNYFDTAYGYGNGASEAAARVALVERYPRDSFLLATKLPAWAGPKTADEAKDMFRVSLERTGAGYFDFYLLHNLGDDRTRSFDEFGIWDFLAEKKAAGLVRRLGFSFHDRADALDKVLTEHPEVDFVQLQINYVDWESNSVESRKCYETAVRHGKPVIVMEPVKGGSLAALPEPAAGIFKSAAPDASLSSWAIRYAASLDSVITVLSGMSTIEQMRDNIDTMKDFKPLSAAEYAVIDRAREAIEALPRIPCTSCGYCMKGCPQNIPIPEIFGAVNTNKIYNNLANACANYFWATGGCGKASSCIACGQCEAVCPQHIGIISELAEAAELFGE